MGSALASSTFASSLSSPAGSAARLPMAGRLEAAKLQALGAQNANTGSKTDTKTAVQAKARANAVDFEAVFLNSMFSQMFTGIDGDGPFGGAGATGVWRSFLTDEYSKSFAKAGGIGIADHVYRSLMAQQEVRG
jgi:Rod binding domain-containing protein